MSDNARKRTELDDLLASKIFPRNLTARADRLVVGNPVSSRLESGVGNDYPGLEYDHRNLDRRFFPGMIFDFVSQDDASSPNLMLRGIRLTSVDINDPELISPTDPANPDYELRNSAQGRALAQDLAGDKGQSIAEGSWFVDEIEQAGVALRTYQVGDNEERVPLDGMTVYHFVRGLEPGSPVRITLGRRDGGAGGRAREVTLVGWRRRFVDYRTGVIGEAYGAGELTQSLCSPWQHDFRDCACNYWASNHPDIVLTEDYPGEPLLPTGGSADPLRANNAVDWLRADRNRDASAEAAPTRAGNRPYQMDHYEINRRWQQLAVVLEGKEISQLYRPGVVVNANPYQTPEEVGQRLVYLATLEHVLILEYLYAYFSVATEEQVDEQSRPGIGDAVVFARHELLMIAISEMRHLRWANQIIWELEHAGLIPEGTGPSLGVAATVPVSPGQPERPRALRALTPQALQDFVEVEAPSGTLDGQYARVAATLRKPPYPATTSQLVERIIADGMEHYSRFREVKFVLRYYTNPQPEPVGRQPYLLDLRPAPPGHPKAAEAVATYQEIVADLSVAYRSGDMEDADYITRARAQMSKLQGLADELAAEGFGVPFFGDGAGGA